MSSKHLIVKIAATQRYSSIKSTIKKNQVAAVTGVMEILTTTEKKARLDFASRYHSFNWNNAVFLGRNDFHGVAMWGVISRFDGCGFREVVGKLKTPDYVSFMDDLIFPTWNANKNLVFVIVSLRYKNQK